MPRRKFSYIDPHYCRVRLVKDAPGPLAQGMTTPQAVVAAVWDTVKDSPVETFWSIPLDARRRPLAYVQVSSGTLTQALAHPREAFAPCFLAHGAALIVVHNHPSGECAPSADDDRLTRQLRSAAEILGIPLLDHMILGSNKSFFSYAQQGWPR